MADNKMNPSSTPNEKKQDESMKREQGQPMTGERKPEQSELNKSKQDEQAREKSAIGGGERQQSQGGQNPSGQQGGQSPAGQDKAFDKNRGEPTSR